VSYSIAIRYNCLYTKATKLAYSQISSTG